MFKQTWCDIISNNLGLQNVIVLYLFRLLISVSIPVLFQFFHCSIISVSVLNDGNNTGICWMVHCGARVQDNCVYHMSAHFYGRLCPSRTHSFSQCKHAGTFTPLVNVKCTTVHHSAYTRVISVYVYFPFLSFIIYHLSLFLLSVYCCVLYVCVSSAWEANKDLYIGLVKGNSRFQVFRSCKTTVVIDKKFDTDD